MSKRLFTIFFLTYFSVLTLSLVALFVLRDNFLLHVFHYGVILALFSLGILIIVLSKVEIFKVKKDKKNSQQQFSVFTKELIETYKHMGTVNRQLEMIKGLVRSSSLTQEEVNQSNLRNILINILSSAAASIRADWGLLRFVDIKKGRTITEFDFNRDKKPANISNRDLLNYLEKKKWHKKYFFVIPDERERETIAFIVFPKTPEIMEADDSFLKTFVNQAQLIFLAFQNKILKRNNKKK